MSHRRRSRVTLDRDSTSGADDFANGGVVELRPLPRSSQEERATRELAQMEHVPRKAEPLAEDRGQYVGVLAGTHRPEQDDLRIGTQSSRDLERRRLESDTRGGVARHALRIALQVIGGDSRIGRDESIGHRDDMHAATPLLWLCECACILELPAKVEAAQEGEDVPQRHAFGAQPPSERHAGPGSSQRQCAGAVRGRRGDQEYARRSRRRHGVAMRNFGARDTFPRVRVSFIPAAVAALALASACVQPPPFETTSPPVNTPQVDVASDSAARVHLIDIRLVDPTIMVDARYATPSNFTGAPLPGYETNRALMRREAAAALARVQKRARNEGVALKVFDAYRPVRATLAMVDWANRTGQQRLLRDGYIASRSRHNLGLAVDLTLVGGDGRELDMGTPFDTFSAAAHTANAAGQVAANRRLLVRLMQAEGFTSYDKEWWHFSYDVPNPMRFDLVIR